MEIEQQKSRLRRVILLLLIRERRKLPGEKSNRQKILGLCLMLRQLRETEQRARRSVWVKEMYTVENRLLHGASNTYVTNLRELYPDDFYNFFRMTREVFELLYNIVSPSITKQNVVREPISSRIRLEVTIRWLATGDNFETLAALFRVSPPSVSNIVNETTQAIWSRLKPLVFEELTEDKWRRNARAFGIKWNHERCGGAIDCKLVRVRPPPHAGSLMYDYKGHHSFHLLAIADADGKFDVVDVGASGRQSDGGVFRNSRIGQLFRRNQMNMPPAEPLVDGGHPIPIMLLGDEGFAQSLYLLRPYTRNIRMCLRKRVFNYRLSRARRIVEAAFGSLTRIWQVMEDPIRTSLKVALQTVHACICLHNFLIMYEERKERRDVEPYDANEGAEQIHGMEGYVDDEPVPREGTPERLRYELSHYFMNEGAVHFQWERAANFNF
ncbi:hypothetical protein QAD02_015322 [Eretmocerus hayati]|uniref:Uncharacterized protein n=1 Tax=Eretmocerus hayati TaxID=131215 RepID=A0ACC2P7Y9_9HYME|nr:hypothetical protein QAD02_015322 [Eretmocerus hayati]